MYANRVHNLAPSAWLVEKDTKISYASRFLPNTKNLNDDDRDLEHLHLGQEKTKYGFEGTPIDTISGEKGEDPLYDKIRRIIKEEMEKPPEQEAPSLNLGITGLNYVFDKKQVIGCKIFWAVIIVACISICSYQMVNRVSLFLGFPVAAEIGVVQNYTVKFPTITICPSETTPLIAVKEKFKEANNLQNKTNEDIHLTDLIGFNGLTAEDVWNLTKCTDNIFFDKWEFKDLLDTTVKVEMRQKEVKLPLGTCVTFQLPHIVQYHGISTQMYFRNPNPVNRSERYAYSIMTHEPYEPVDMKSVSPVTAGAKVGFTVLVKQYQAMSTPIDACVSTEDNYKCYMECAHNILENSVKCKLPYMEERSNLPVCSDPKQASEEHERANDILLDLNATRDCGCIRKCLRVMYSMLPKSYKFGSPETEVSIYYASNYFEIVQESYAYDWMSLLCDVGGNLGLYLGLSVLSIFEVVQSIFEMFKESIRSTHGPQVKPVIPVKPIVGNYMRGY